MPCDLVIPAAVEAVIQEFEHAASPFTESDVYTALTKARASLQNPSDEDSFAAWAEVLAFALQAERTDKSPWRTFFGPMGSVTREDGKKLYLPDIGAADARVIDHWRERAKAIGHPILKARYADLAWEMCAVIARTRRDPAMAHFAIDAYLASVSAAVRPELYHRFEAALRALDLAALIRDPERTKRARAALLQLHQGVMTALNGPWWFAFDRLIDDKHAGATEEERRLLIADLEKLVLHYGNTSENFDPHALQSTAQRLIKHYTRLGRSDDVRRLHEAIARAFEHFASLGNALLASAVLQTAVNAYRAAGLSEDSKRVRILMQEKIGQAHDHMAAVGTEIKIPREDIEKFLKVVILDDLGSTFVRIAAEFLPKRSDLEDQVQQSLREAPLMAHLHRTIMADDHVAAKVGSVEDDPFGRLLQQTTLNFAVSGIWLQVALQRTIETHGVTPEHFVGWANRAALFDDLTFLIEGVRAWYEGDLVKAIHVLVPQVESGLRGIVAQLGKPVTKPHATISDVGVAIGMGDILYSEELTEALGPDLTLYFLALYADPRGKNLRNRVAHGLIKPEFCDGDLVRLLIHTLLIFGLWKELAAQRR